MLSALLLFLHTAVLPVDTPSKMVVSSPMFSNRGDMPARFTCDDADISPSLDVNGVPKKAKSLAIVFESPDSNSGNPFVHWLVWNISPTGATIKENSSPGVVGRNSAGENLYMGPCHQAGTRQYQFKVYALDMMLDLDTDTDKKGLEMAVRGHIIGTGTLVAYYSRRSRKAGH